MINWLSENLGTAAFDKMAADSSVRLVDVRDMVDKAGNLPDVAQKKIDAALAYLSRGEKVVICCDYGRSRSNAIAAGILALSTDMTFNQALRHVVSVTGQKEIDTEVLNVVREAVKNRLPDEAETKFGAKKRVLVTGGSGFIGGVLLSRLGPEYEVVAPPRDEINLAEGAIELALAVKERGIDLIIHLANPRVYTSNKAFGESLVMLRNVLDVCKGNDVKLVYPSGWEIYSGYRANALLAAESLPAYPKGPYGEAKYFCETLIEQYKRQYGVKCVILRSSPVYGGGDKPKFLYNFLHKAAKGEPVFTHKYINGFPHLDLLHIDDLISALLAIIDADVDRSFNIGGGRGISTAEVAKLIITQLSSSSKIEHRDIQDLAPNIVMDTSRINRELGWVPRVDFEEGLKSMTDRYVGETVI